MNIFVTLDRNYLNPLKVMLGSLYLNNPGEDFAVYLAADGVEARDLDGLDRLLIGGNVRYHFLEVDAQMFADAPVVRYYSKAMYYRLLAAWLLPESVDRVLYLDPDILVIGKVRELYHMDMGNSLYAAAMHRGLIGISASISKVRLPDHDSDSYFNSGVLLMDLEKLRKDTDRRAIFEYVEKYQHILILPDQDVLNGLFGARIHPIDERIWNYDARKFETYRLASQGKADMDWVMNNTVFLHFCGKKKPWNAGYAGRFAALYKHYRAMIARCCE